MARVNHTRWSVNQEANPRFPGERFELFRILRVFDTIIIYDFYRKSRWQK